MLRCGAPTHPRAGGFGFENCQRNECLEKELSQQGLKVPKARKTGTTIAGLVFKDGVILGADTRATDDMVVADKNCLKIHPITSRIYCCGAGVAADAEATTQLLSSNLQLHALSTGREPRVVTACRMLKQMLFRYKGHIGASLIVGGVDCRGPHLYTVHPHGSTDKLPFVSMGSGAGAAMSILEDRFKPNMELNTALDLLRDSIKAGILCDLGSGSNVDVCIITKEKVELVRSYDQPVERGERHGSYRYQKGTTTVLAQSVKPLELELVEENVQTMDTE
ncbi:proteasome subunit beta type-7-like [Rhinatrema bivittatum]|uniref:proteasome subunit beta type-7-like n=1 Tax=Rhinatrema bivittatum TaxID=194408 RepID=UPI00112A3B90|nr:proteasome subunit beta type-7-like [Rhinatrema bivittatum]